MYGTITSPLVSEHAPPKAANARSPSLSRALSKSHRFLPKRDKHRGLKSHRARTHLHRLRKSLDAVDIRSQLRGGRSFDYPSKIRQIADIDHGDLKRFVGHCCRLPDPFHRKHTYAVFYPIAR